MTFRVSSCKTQGKGRGIFSVGLQMGAVLTCLSTVWVSKYDLDWFWVRSQTGVARSISLSPLMEKHQRNTPVVAPQCGIPQDYLGPTAIPLLRAMGFLVSQHGQIGAIPPPPFQSVFPVESMQSGGAIPTPRSGYLSDTCARSSENQAKRMRYPPLRYHLDRVLRDVALGR